MAEMIIRNMLRSELDELVEWAAREGWNPGLSDADLFWAYDPQAFIAAEISGQLIGGGSIVSYEGLYGFMGFFIIHPDYRGRGLGNRLWHERLQRLQQRLVATASIGMDGVFDMQDYYARGGFSFTCRDLRFEGLGRTVPVPDEVVMLDDVSFADVDAYDRAHFPAARGKFLKPWISQPGCHARGVIRNGRLCGFAVMRPCRAGHKIGPLFANDAGAANDLFLALAGQVPGEAIFLDVPENNPAGLELAKRHAMNEVFGCAKMYFGTPPELPDHEIFGITTFEFG
jgi:ribosomal protein S18 acetylase RimI-like enzyme